MLVLQKVFQEVEGAEIGLVTHRHPAAQADRELIADLQQAVSQRTALGNNRKSAQRRHRTADHGGERRGHARFRIDEAHAIRADQANAGVAADCG